MNIETKMIAYLNKNGFKAYANVPAKRPGRFVTVERVGGGFDNYAIDRPVVAVQAWGEKRLDASELAYSIRGALLKMVNEPDICKVSVNSIYNFPDADSGAARYQLVADIVTM